MERTEINQSEELIKCLKQLNKNMASSIDQLNFELALLENELQEGSSRRCKKQLLPEAWMTYISA